MHQNCSLQTVLECTRIDNAGNTGTYQNCPRMFYRPIHTVSTKAYTVYHEFNDLKNIFFSVLLHCIHISGYFVHLLYQENVFSVQKISLPIRASEN